MEFITHNFFRYFLFTFLLIPPQNSELFTVHSPAGPLVALVGKEVKLHCYISPAQNAEHMEVRWFHKSLIKPHQLYQSGKNLYRETILDNMERAEIIKEDIDKGNVTLLIQKVRESDGGKYRCLFKNGNITKETVLELKVIDPDLELEIQVHINIMQEFKIECLSGGWFSHPQMQWINSRGELIPPSSKFESMDESGLFHMQITLFLREYQGMITCHVQNPVTGQEKNTSLEVADFLIKKHKFGRKYLFYYFISICILIVITVFFIVILYLIQLQLRNNARPHIKDFLISFVKIYFLFMTPSITCFCICSIYIINMTKDLNFSLERVWMRKTFESLYGITLYTSILILFLYWLILKMKIGR